MKAALSALAAILLAAPAVRAYVTNTPQVQMSFTLMADRTIATAWPGVEGRTYFMQWSVDLVHWHYLPMMRHGVGSHTYQLPAQTEPNFHLRLHFDDTATTDPANDDFDYDGITNWDEVTDTLTDPLDSDTDKDGMDDGWEKEHGFDPNDPADAQGDPDGDGLTNFLEFWHGTTPHLADTDGDGISDGDEVLVHGTSPLLGDSDGDGLSDSDEILVYGTDPLWVDTDGDTLWDDEEVLLYGTSPLKIDTDGDWMWDDWEIDNGLDPLDPADGEDDYDNDGLPNRLEFVFVDHGYDPFVTDSANGFPWNEDPDGDGHTTAQEWAVRTHPRLIDTDGDGLPDGWERLHNLDPNNPNGEHGATGDPDNDGLTNFDEWLYHTDPRDADTDNDGTNDGAEIAAHSDPLRNEPAPPADPDNNLPVAQFEDVLFRVGDSSGSESERWKMTVTGLGPDDFRSLGLASAGFGTMAEATFRLRKWNTYEITLTHLGTSPQELRLTGGPDYDWEAAVGGPEERSFASYSVLRNHWLADNSGQLLAQLREGNEANLTIGLKTTLVPVDIDDNQPASGTDDISCTAPSTAGGYQPDHWIMAPAGPVPEDPFWGNTMVWNTPLPSNPTLSMFTLAATRNPPEVSLDRSQPSVVWRGATVATTEDTPAWSLDPPNQPAYTPVDLPVKVKVMKKRTVRVVCYKVRMAGVNDGIPTFDDTDCLRDALNRVFGWQVNAWFEVDLRLSPYEDDYDLNGDGWLQASNPDGTRSDEAQAIIDSIPNRDTGADIHVYLLDRGLGNEASQPLPPGQTAISNILGCTPRDGGRNHVFISPRSSLTTEEDMFETICHEVGHVFCGPGHPDGSSGPAPLQGTDRTERLMHSQSASGQRLVKAEWDQAEEWMKRREEERANQ